MKRIILLILFIGIYNVLYAQKFSAIADIGYRPGFERPSKVGMGVQFKYEMIRNLYLATDLIGYIPQHKHGTKGMDIGVTVQYLIKPFSNKWVFYPAAGLAIVNHDFTLYGGRGKMTDFGFNLGVGSEYRINNRSFINGDFKYFLLKRERPQRYDDYGLVRLGYGFRF